MSFTTFLQKSLFKFIAKGATPTHRPAPLGRQAQNHTQSWGFAYYLEQEVSIFSDIVLTLKQEMFRRGFTWEPLFTYKCQDCETIYQDEITECECGSTNLIEPDKSQMSMFENGEHTYIRTANSNGQSLQEVLSDFEFNMDVADNAYIILLKSYIYSNAGKIIESEIREILSVDPRGIKKIADESGRLGNLIWVCPEHRDVTETSPGHICSKCKNKLLPAYYETTGTSDKQYYLKDEVIHSSKFYPSILYGYPPILKAVDTALAYHYLEKRTLSFYERGRAPGIATFPTNNQASLRAFWDETMERLQDDPYYIPIVGYDSGGKAGASFLKLMEDPNTDMLEVKKELRERIGSRFGVSLIFQGDTSTSGGLNNEGLQITVTNRAIEDGQRIYNEKIFPWLCSQFGITDYVLQLNPNEEADEMADKERFSQETQNAIKMQELGYVATFDASVEEFTYEFNPDEVHNIRGVDSIEGIGIPSEIAPDTPIDEEAGVQAETTLNGAQITAAIEVMNSVTLGSIGELAALELLVAVGIPREKSEDIISEASKLDVSDVIEQESMKTLYKDMNDDYLVKDFAADALAAIKAGALFPDYEGVNVAETSAIHGIIEDAYLSNELSLTSMIDKVLDATGLDEAKARLILRTESSAVSMKAREIGWTRQEEERGEVFKFRVSTKFDSRTSDISKRIHAKVQREGGAVTLKRMKEIYKEESTKSVKNGGMGSDWTGWESFVAHPHERDTIVRVI
ncbi:MAG: hypothetical protein KAJ93_02290 [Methanosarcinales archaeon]|nr:hypothetical protein [Methanosarcinales archaeon]